MTAARESALREILQKIATEQKYNDPVFNTDAVPTTGSNFTSQLFHATIKSSNKDDLNLFAKVSVLGEAMRKDANAGNFFDMEPYFYQNVVSKFNDIQDEYNVPDEERLNIPKFYGASNEYMKEVLVLGDLSKDGYGTYDRQKSVTWEYASRSFEQLAKFHALFFAYQERYPEEFEEAKKVLQRPMMTENEVMMGMVTKSIEQATQMVKEEHREKLKNFFSSLEIQQYMEFYMPRKRPVIIHSDFRPSNLMHKVDENGKLQVAVMDFQTMHSGPVALDLLYYIFSGSDGEFRAKHYDQLIEHYYENLVASLKRLGMDPEQTFPRADFDEELKEMLPFGLMLAVMILPLITIDLQDVITNDEGVYEGNDLADLAGMFTKVNSLYATRMNEVVDDYVKWGIL